MANIVVVASGRLLTVNTTSMLFRFSLESKSAVYANTPKN